MRLRVRRRTSCELEVEDHGKGIRRHAGTAAGSAWSRCASAPNWSAARSSSTVRAKGGTCSPSTCRCLDATSRWHADADKITVLLADDHSLVRRGFRRMLEDDPSIEVIGEASNGDEAIALAAALKPAVIVMDCAMPGTSGLVATRQILARDPTAPS